MSPKQTGSAPHTDRASIFPLSITLPLLFSVLSSFSPSHTPSCTQIDATHTLRINPLLCIPSYPVQFTLETYLIKTARRMLQHGIYSSYFWASCWLYNAVAVTINHSCFVYVCVFSIVTSWEVNAIGHPVVLPLKVCEELLQVIDDSNSTLPTSMRCMRSYEVR